MLKISCINPRIMDVLSQCGHGDKILIADGNYPIYSQAGNARIVCLGLCPGIPSVPDVLKVLAQTIPIERAEVMFPSAGQLPAIAEEFRPFLDGAPLDGHERFDFYQQCCLPDVRLAILTGETRTFANLLLTVGVA